GRGDGCVVVGDDQWARRRVRWRRGARRVEYGEPLAVGARAVVDRIATEQPLLHGRPAIAGGRRPQAEQGVEVGKILLAGVIEVDVGIASTGRVVDPADAIGR